MGSNFVAFPNAGSVTQISLVEILTASGLFYCLSEKDAANMSSFLSGPGYPALYQGWVNGPCVFTLPGSTETETATIPIQNVSGNTVQRDAAMAVSRYEFIGAFVYYRLWDLAAEQALFTWMGNVEDVEVDGDTLQLSINGFGNLSAVRAPGFDIGVSCGLSFGSPQCGSTSTACDQSWGGCTSPERFMGVIVQWDSSQGSPSPVQIAQPAPLNSYNAARAV